MMNNSMSSDHNNSNIYSHQSLMNISFNETDMSNFIQID